MSVSIENLRKFVAPEIIFGNGARYLAGEYCKKFYIAKPMIVTDPGVIAAGWADQVAQTLIEHDIAYVTFSKVTPNPREEETMMGAAAYLAAGCDGIIAVGGGSPMDCAKGIRGSGLWFPMGGIFSIMREWTESWPPFPP